MSKQVNESRIMPKHSDKSVRYMGVRIVLTVRQKIPWS